MAMPAPEPALPQTIQRDLVRDELFDLTLYRRFHAFSTGPTRELLAELIPVEERHLAFWQDRFDIRTARLDALRRIKLEALVWTGRLLGSGAVRVILEAIEVYGIRKYLDLWDRTRGTGFADQLTEILKDEFGHEDEIVSAYADRTVNPERIRGIFLGFNDGLVEILGAVSGFYAAFGSSRAVLVAGLTVTIAGAVSMGAGAYAASNSESEVRSLDERKRRFLGTAGDGNAPDDHPLLTAGIVAGSYVVGSAFPIIPVLAGAASPLLSILFGGLAIIVVSGILAFLSGMQTRSRILVNIATIVFAVGISTLIGFLVRALFGISV